jgi:hypothetical protein
MEEKKNFNSRDFVRIHSTNSPELDGQLVRILGKSHVHITDTYIVELTTPVFTFDGFENYAICLTEACLDY